MAVEVKVLSPAKVVKEVKADQLQLPGIEGYLGILEGHTAFVTEIGVGEMNFVGGEAGGERFFVCGGYLEVENDVVTVLADVVESRESIDRGRAEKSRERALERLKANDSAMDMSRAQLALNKADARLELLSR